jgi:hypothetical protein
MGTDGTEDGSGRWLGAGKRSRVLDELRRVPVIGYAARRAGSSPAALYRLRKRSPAFDSQVRAALREGIDRLEAETFAEAMLPSEKGNPRHLLKMFVLKAHRPKYRDTVQITGSVRHEIVVDLVPALAVGAVTPESPTIAAGATAALPVGRTVDLEADDYGPCDVDGGEGD